MRYILLVIYILIVYCGKAFAEEPIVRYSTLLGSSCYEGAEFMNSCDIVADVDSEGYLYFIAEFVVSNESMADDRNIVTHRLIRINTDGSGIRHIMDIDGPCHIRRLICHRRGCIYIEYGTPDAYILRKITPAGKELGRISLPYSPSCSFIDQDGNVFIAGSVGRGDADAVLVTENAMFGSFIGGEGDKDIFIMRYGPGFDLRYGSFLGGPGLDYPVSITSDSRRNVILSCYSLSNEFKYLPGGDYPSQAVLVFNFILDNLVYGWRSSSGSDYYPSGYDTCYDPCTNSIYDVGDRNSLFKFSSVGECIWTYSTKETATEVTGSSALCDGRLGRGISVDESGDIYYSMDVDDDSFPVTADAIDPDFNGGPYDITVSRVGSNGDLQFATYFGGSGTDKTSRHATSYKNGVFYCVGITDSQDFPTTIGAYMGQALSEGYSLFAFAIDFNNMVCQAGVNRSGSVTETFGLDPPHPNPFNPSVTLSFSLPETGPVQVAIYNIAGQLVRELTTKALPAGRHEIVWDGLDSSGVKVSSGVYFARLNAGVRAAVRKVTLVR